MSTPAARDAKDRERRDNPVRPPEPGSPKTVHRSDGEAEPQDGPEPDGTAASGVVHQPGRPAESISGGLGGVQQDDEGGLSGQGLDPDTVNPTHQRDDNQDDLGRDINDPRRKSTNNQ